MADSQSSPNRKKPVGVAIRGNGNTSVAQRELPVRTVTAQVQSKKLIADRRQRIIRAAITVFHELGFHNATTADIAREAGLTQSNLYNYVKSKQDVLFLVCEHLVGTYNQVLDDVSAKYEDPYERICQGLAAIINVMSLYRDELQLLYNETHALEKPDRLTILDMISQFISRFQVLLEDYERETGVKTMMDRRLAANLMSFVPAIVALRNWDLVRHNSKPNAALLYFILNGLGIHKPI